MEDNNRLNAKDLINVGIYTAICAVICCVIAMTGIIPIMMVLLVVFVPIFTGTPYMMFLTKVKKFGMILILNVLMGALMWVTGMSYYALVVGTLSGLAAEFIYRAGNYKSKKLGVLAYAISGKTVIIVTHDIELIRSACTVVLPFSGIIEKS